MRDSQPWSNHAYAPIPRACIVCGGRAVPGSSRCRAHKGKPGRTGPNPYGWDWQQLREQAKATLPLICGVCGGPILPGQPYHLDHIKPRSLGGINDIDNVQWTHQRCNISKGGANRKRTR